MKLTKTCLFLSAVTAMLIGLTASALADTTANLAVSAKVKTSCYIKAGSLAFPDYDPTDSNATVGQGQLTVACTKNATTAAVSLDGGSTPGASTGSNDRTMKNGTETLTYALFSDSTRTSAWNAGGSVSITPADNKEHALNVYGSISALQDVSANLTFTDTVVATINF